VENSRKKDLTKPENPGKPTHPRRIAGGFLLILGLSLAFSACDWLIGADGANGAPGGPGANAVAVVDAGGTTVGTVVTGDVMTRNGYTFRVDIAGGTIRAVQLYASGAGGAGTVGTPYTGYPNYISQTGAMVYRFKNRDGSGYAVTGGGDFTTAQSTNGGTGWTSSSVTGYFYELESISDPTGLSLFTPPFRYEW
jgi:hypothetical protein